ncbi:MAG: hypothetical protein H6624_19340 [Bdellovibrionaceae bacterium]|nr:hypothetical protein [Bdellovibrionales bacterium]MCB9086504.1 hypothetical protein [Pseudobdellovibrionaceae bacterium]
MKRKALFASVLLVALSGLFLMKAEAADLDWTGIYRIEGYHIVNSEVSGDDREKDYGLHHLVLKPKIVAGDGLTIYGRFDLFNSSDVALANSQMGQVFGSGIGGAATNANDSDALAQRQKSENLEVTQLYMTYVQEHGAFIAGRAPLHFGLGATYNAGEGLWDHWFDTRDLVGYKMMFGNLYLLPMMAKIDEDALNRADDVTEYMIQLQYENPETDLEMGIFYSTRKANDSGNDAPKGTAPGEPFGGASGARRKLDLQTTSLYAIRDRQNMRIGVEASIQGGKTGVETAAGGNTSMSGFGVAVEFEYRPESSKSRYGFLAGIASGDDPTTDDKFEGFIFDKNYDVAFLMFNHPLGQADFLRTSLAGSGAGTVPISGADTEAISNVIYFAPYLKYAWKDNWEVNSTLIAGFLNQDPILGVDVDKDLGYELDVELSYSPKKGVVWSTEMGLLMPGKAFEGGGSFDAEFGYGLSTKAAISF